MLIISVLPPQARLSQASVSHVCKVVLDHSQKPGSEVCCTEATCSLVVGQKAEALFLQLQLPALQCIRTLISATAKGGPVQLLCAAQIMPILSAQIFDNTAEQKLSGPCLVEFLRILTTFAMSFPQSMSSLILCLRILLTMLQRKLLRMCRYPCWCRTWMTARQRQPLLVNCFRLHHTQLLLSKAQ